MNDKWVNGSESTEHGLREIRVLLERIAARLDEVAAWIQSRQAEMPRTGDVDGWESLSESELRTRIETAREANDPYSLLEWRARLATVLNEPDQRALDRDLALWMTDFFQKALRGGRAVHFAGAIERAVREMGDIPEMELLADALPVIMRSVGLEPASPDDE